MQIFIFQSRRDGKFIAYTDQQDGNGLPADLEPWEQIGCQEIQIGDHVVHVQDGGNTVLDGIRRDGFLLVTQR